MDELRLGAVIQELRMQRGISVRKLSSLAGVTPSMISQIENDQVNPSINTLRAIAQALETPLYSFFQGGEKNSPVVHPQERLTIGTKDEPNVRYELLTSDTRGEIEFCMMMVPPHQSSYRDIRSHRGEEVAYMLSGESLVLELNNARYTLQPGDSVRIAAGLPHAWHNEKDEEACVIFAITPPSF